MSVDSNGNGSVRSLARTAGLFYLLVIVLGSGTLMLRGSLLVRGDGAATAANIAAQPWPYRLSLLAEIGASLSYIVVVVLLFHIMAPAGRKLTTLAAAFGLAGCVAGAVAVVPLTIPLIEGAGTGAEAAALAVGLYTFAYKIALIFFGTYCLLLGILIVRAAFLPAVLGVLLIASGLSWWTTGVAIFLSPAAAKAVGMAALAGGGLGESLFTLWLIAFGINPKRWQPD